MKIPAPFSGKKVGGVVRQGTIPLLIERAGGSAGLITLP
jgi:hypothetical protein